MFRASKTLPYPALFLRNIVADVEQYPTFLPMIKAVKIFPKTSDFFYADVTVGSGILEKTYRSEVAVYDESVEAKAQPDNVFKFLESCWSFESDEANRCQVNFFVNFELRSSLLQLTVGKVLDSAAKVTMTAFEQRAAGLWKNENNV